MKTAFPYWHDRIAPVFDTARLFLIIESEAGIITHEDRMVISEDNPTLKILRLVESDVVNLVCGAISRPTIQIVMAYGIKMTPFIAGGLREIVHAWVEGRLEYESFAMPGCRRRRGKQSRGGRHQQIAEKNFTTEKHTPHESSEEKYGGLEIVCQAAIRRRKM